jgi:uncharacterized protein YsxB (DUF464 family)
LIVITHNQGSITIKGHAGYAPIGQDIVCAAVSTLAQTLIQSIEDLCTDKIKYVVSPGTVDIKHGDLSRGAQLLIDSFFVGVQMVADSYPDNVKVVKNTGAGVESPTKKATESGQAWNPYQKATGNCDSFKKTEVQNG